MSNTFGRFFRIHSFGESHGRALGVVIDGCPAGVRFDEDLLNHWCQRRRPGQATADGRVAVTSRDEKDRPEILSGVFEEKTLGTPIAILVNNSDARSADYNREMIRAGHADDIWQNKFGHRDFRGGGRSSGRETVSRVLAGAVAQMFVQSLWPKLQVLGFTEQMGELRYQEDISFDSADQFPLRFPHRDTDLATSTLMKAKQDGESFGGVAQMRVQNAPQGLGQPVFGKLKSELAAAYMSVGATLGVEFGGGFQVGSQAGTQFHGKTQDYGGMRGGISTGEPISARVVFKPTSSILDVAKKGRHDPCIVPRAVPVLEAMTWLVLADAALAARMDQL